MVIILHTHNILEHLVETCLEWYVDHFELVPNSQLDFECGQGTIYMLLHLVVDLQLYLSHPYGKVSVPTVAQELRHLQILQSFACSVLSLFQVRRLIAFLDQGTIGPRLTRMGLAQGSVLSSLLFNIYTSDLLNILSGRIRVFQYADSL
ncbi:uncharacterized protein LOC124616437 [Schistocerca americana]|uniref:uncharacterized protein LOC124616437 n=1 Tax=Schistocerca americana TaxID=7009 RepID=UPI001F4F245C|nr:uncharacterized protein LOC124616437 [Schistocerca americana]